MQKKKIIKFCIRCSHQTQIWIFSFKIPSSVQSTNKLNWIHKFSIWKFGCLDCVCYVCCVCDADQCGWCGSLYLNCFAITIVLSIYMYVGVVAIAFGQIHRKAGTVRTQRTHKEYNEHSKHSEHNRTQHITVRSLAIYFSLLLIFTTYYVYYIWSLSL